MTLQAFHGNEVPEGLARNPDHEDSIEEMASMLLDDTTIDQLKADPGKRFSQVSLPAIVNGDNELLQHEASLWSAENTVWIRHSSPAPPASSLQPIEYDSSEDELNTFPPPIADKRVPAHLRKTSAPEIPRRSSKRNSGRYKSSLSSPQKVIGHSRNSSSANRLSKNVNENHEKIMNMAAPAHASSSFDVVAHNNKMQAALAAGILQMPATHSAPTEPTAEPSSATKKPRHIQVFSMVKAAFRGSRHGKKSPDPVRGDRLLNSPNNGSPGMEDEATLATMTSSLEIRLNEGENLKNHHKLKKITGHGTIERKPVADDGKSLRSRQSHDRDDPFSESPPRGQRRLVTSFENRLKPDVPMSGGQSNETIPEVPKIPRSMTTMSLLRGTQSLHAASESDFDTLVSSSPEGQSTPRMRLEPQFGEDGKKTLKIAPTEARSMFDSDMTMGGHCDEPRPELQFQRSQSFEPESRTDFVEVMNKLGLLESASKPCAQANGSGNPEFTLQSPTACPSRQSSEIDVRCKKHPSPNKTQLENLESDFAAFYFLQQRQQRSANVDQSPTRSTRHLIDEVVSVGTNSRAPDTLSRSEISRAMDSTTNLARLTHQRFSSLSGFSNHHSRRSSTLSDSRMDMDELQSESSAYKV
ncbi:hypothetical protein HYFRA_00011444 [Hymenoscyphus fraxineus]|uniref:Uncharacterized protein n=1 Tax=Hymenoscyphus fraxineus TaxID=746836 RepID=A0A9N9L3G3_9HELO|nr:hypothetical protein HYFRA_00011444 [Hymenoscyphus fraxineus]